MEFSTKKVQPLEQASFFTGFWTTPTNGFGRFLSLEKILGRQILKFYGETRELPGAAQVNYAVAGIFREEFSAVSVGGGLYRGGTLQHWYFTALGIFSSKFL